MTGTEGAAPPAPHLHLPFHRAGAEAGAGKGCPGHRSGPEPRSPAQSPGACLFTTWAALPCFGSRLDIHRSRVQQIPRNSKIHRDWKPPTQPKAKRKCQQLEGRAHGYSAASHQQSPQCPQSTPCNRHHYSQQGICLEANHLKLLRLPRGRGWSGWVAERSLGFPPRAWGERLQSQLGDLGQVM